MKLRLWLIVFVLMYQYFSTAQKNSVSQVLRMFPRIIMPQIDIFVFPLPVSVSSIHPVLETPIYPPNHHSALWQKMYTSRNSGNILQRKPNHSPSKFNSSPLMVRMGKGDYDLGPGNFSGTSCLTSGGLCSKNNEKSKLVLHRCIQFHDLLGSRRLLHIFMGEAVNASLMLHLQAIYRCHFILNPNDALL